MAKKAKDKEVMTLEQELEREAAEAAKEESSGLTTLSTAGGILKYNGQALPDNQVACVILANAFENARYLSDYDADNPQPPDCYAVAHNEDDLIPAKNVVDRGDAIADSCEQCPDNEWGSADKGKGKACKNGRRLALLHAGNFDDDGNFEIFEDTEDFQGGEVVFLKVSPTSLKNFSGYVKTCATLHKRPLHTVVTLVSVEPDAKTQFQIKFKMLEKLTGDALSICRERAVGLAEEILYPYPDPKEEEAPPPRAKPRTSKSRPRKR